MNSLLPPGDGGYFNPAFVWPEETSVAFATRLRFIAGMLAQVRARSVLDVGCGTGEQLTAWLAQLCPQCQFLGVDDDAVSIAHAQRIFADIPNLKFDTQLPAMESHDAVIASEVLEHVAEPYAFLATLRQQIAPSGLLLITTPNGYGCSEWMSLAETVLTLTKIWPIVRNAKRWLCGQRIEEATAAKDTHAISPHVNFFTLRRLYRIFDRLGLKVTAYQGRMFLHHFVCTMLIDRSRFLSQTNARLGGSLPAGLVSDWMFALQMESAMPRVRPYRRTWYERVKRNLNLRRFGLAG
jgi:2-polyprenyl-3-methyl-5-hydroxy-6-metoxy-1,4-benzoquinol methylase